MDQNSASASHAMVPPSISRATRRYRNDEWEVHRDLIVGMYPMQGMKLKAIKEMLEQDHGFLVNERQLKKKIEDWKIAKNVQSSEMAFIVRKQKQRTIKRASVHFRVRGQPVEPGKISRWQNRPENALKAIGSPLPSTPSDISYSPASFREPSPRTLDIGHHPNVSSGTSIEKWSPNLNGYHNAYLHSTNVVVAPDILAGNSLNAITVSDYNPFEGQSPAPFTPIPSPAPSPRMVPASLRIQSSFDTDSGVPHQAHSSIQFLSPSEGSNTQPSRDMLLLESTNSLSQDIDVSEKPNAPAARIKTRYREAEELDLRRRLYQFEASHGSNHPATLHTMSRLGEVLLSQGRLRSAGNCYQTVAEQSRILFGEDDLRTIAAFLDFAGALHNQSNLVPAERLCRKLSTKILTLVPAEHSMNLQINTGLGLCLHGLGHVQEAEQIFNEVINLGHRSNLQLDDALLLRPMEYLARFQIDRGDFVEAERSMLAILTALGGDGNSEDVNTMSLRALLGSIYSLQGKCQESESLLGEVSAVQSRVLGAEHQETLKTQAYLARVLNQQGKHEESECLLQGVINISQKTLGEHHIDTLQSRLTLIKGYNAQRRFEEAEVNAKQVLAFSVKALGEDHTICNHALCQLGSSYEGQYRLQEALEMFRKASAGSVRTWGENNRYTMEYKRRFTELQGRMTLHSGASGIEYGVGFDLQFPSVTVV